MKLIKLTQGKFAMVDDEDFEKLNMYKWYVSSRGYAVRNSRKNENCKRTSIRMHLKILKVSKANEIDHINGNRLDNRKGNLRICTHQQNNMNKGLYKNNTSGFKGVSWHKITSKWQVKIKFNGKTIRIGTFVDKNDAGMAYVEFSKKLFGEFYRYV